MFFTKAEMPICYDRNSLATPESFREKVREAMQYDNATLLFSDGIATGINLDSGFFSKAARHIYTFREAAFRRKKHIKDHIYFSVISDDIIRSHCPTYMPRPYGARTRISSCAVIGLIDPPLFFLYCKTHFNLSIGQAEIFAEQLDKAQDPVITNDGTVLYQPYLIICHGTRYKENSLTGLTRLLGIGNSDKMPKKDIIFGSIKSAVWNSFSTVSGESIVKSTPFAKNLAVPI